MKKRTLTSLIVATIAAMFFCCNLNPVTDSNIQITEQNNPILCIQSESNPCEELNALLDELFVWHSDITSVDIFVPKDDLPEIQSVESNRIDENNIIITGYTVNGDVLEIDLTKHKSTKHISGKEILSFNGKKELGLFMHFYDGKDIRFSRTHIKNFKNHKQDIVFEIVDFQPETPHSRDKMYAVSISIFGEEINKMVSMNSSLDDLSTELHMICQNNTMEPTPVAAMCEPMLNNEILVHEIETLSELLNTRTTLPWQTILDGVGTGLAGILNPYLGVVYGVCSGLLC